MDSRKKILVCTTSYLPFIGGAEIAVQEVSRRFSDTFDVIIITARQHRALSRHEVLPEGTVIRLGFGGALDKWILPCTALFTVIKLAWAGKIPAPWRRASRHTLALWGMDISQGSLACYFIKTIFPYIPFLLTIQYGYGDARLEKGRGGAIGFVFRRMLKAADGVTAISSYLMNTAHLYGFAGVEKIIPNGVDTSLFTFRSADEDTKKRKQRQRIIITTSRLVEKNAVDMLIRAIAEVKKRMSVKCYVIGDGPERPRLEKLTKEFGLERDVIFLGTIPYEEIPFYLRRADVFVRPSRSEGMGNSFVEALSAGIPVIGTPVGGIPDIIDDGNTGIFCRVDDAGDIAEKIIMLLHDDALVASLRKNGKRLVEEKFSWHAIARSYGDLFEKLLHARMRALICTPLYPPEIGGPATYAQLLAEHLLDAGIGVRILRFSEVRASMKIMRHAAYACKALCRVRGYDSLFALDPVSVGFPTAVAALIARKPLIIKIGGDYAWEQGVQRFGVTESLDEFLKNLCSGRTKWLRKIQQFSASRAACIIVPSIYLKRVVTAWGVDARNIHVIANAETIETISSSREELRNAFALSGTVLLSAGRLVPWKGFGLLIGLIPELIKNYPDITLLIAGSGPQKEELESLISAKGLNDRIKLLGPVSHKSLLGLMKAADLFVLATAYEGLSHTMLEAMAMGAIVVASKAGGNPELVENRLNGFLFDLDNHENITETIREALALSDDRKTAVKKAAIAHASGYRPERVIETTADFMSTLLFKKS